MIKHIFEDRESWLQARKGKITGSRLGDIVVKRGTAKKKGFYELIAERIAQDPDGENPMDRGNRLESEAISRFMFETGKSVNTELQIWTREDNENIALSPDGTVEDTDDTEAVEVKCLNSASHIQAFLTKEIPNDYEYQKFQYFITNDKLQKLYFIFYDPRVTCKDFFFLEINRADVQDEIDALLDYQKQTLIEIDEIVQEFQKCE